MEPHILADSPANFTSPENSISPATIPSPLQTQNNETTLTFTLSTGTIVKSYSTSKLSADLIASSQDLLTEILLRLPVKSLVRFTSVSKQWYSLIKSSSFFVLVRNPNPNPPSGLFFEGWDARSRYHFVPLDLGNPVTRSPFTSLDFGYGAMKIVQSCNGLLLCANDFQKYFVYNPSINRYTILPQLNDNADRSCCMTLAFDPSKSPHYKVVCNYMYKVMMIEVYSSELGEWRVSSESMDGLVDLDRGVYGHNAVHWMSFPNRLVYLKLDEDRLHYIDIDSPDITIYGTLLDEFLVESCDGMLLVVRCCRLRRLNVYEIKKDYSEWYIKYHIDLESVIRVYPTMQSRLGLHFVVQALVLGGEGGEDSFMVLELPGKLIQYKFVSNVITQLCDFTNESRKCTHGGFFPKTIFQLSDFTPENRRFINGSCFHFIPSLASV